MARLLDHCLVQSLVDNHSKKSVTSVWKPRLTMKKLTTKGCWITTLLEASMSFLEGKSGSTSLYLLPKVRTSFFHSRKQAKKKSTSSYQIASTKQGKKIFLWKGGLQQRYLCIHQPLHYISLSLLFFLGVFTTNAFVNTKHWKYNIDQNVNEKR